MSNNQLSLFDQEIWRWIKGFEGHYKVSNFGRVMSVRFGKMKIRKTSFWSNGYERITLKKNGKCKTIGVHSLVVYAFLPPCPGNHGTGTSDWQIDHIDEDKTNNHASNLRWLTRLQNVRRAVAKLTEADIIAIRADTRPCRVIAIEYGVSKSQISNIKRREHWSDL